MMLKQNFKYYLAGTVSLLTALVYLPTLQNDFVMWDDTLYVLENTHIRSLDAAFFKWAFFNFYASNWYPLTWLSHAVDYAIWGLNPLGPHLVNNILHAVNTFLVVLVTIQLIKVRKESLNSTEPSELFNERTIVIAAGITGLLFGLHPLHVESVAWVAERKDLLCAIFFLFSILGYIRFVGSTRSDPGYAKLTSLASNKHYLYSLGWFVLALMSKPMAVTLPVVLLLLDWYPFFKIRSFKTIKDALIVKLPFIVLSLISSIITIFAQQQAMVSMDRAPIITRVLVAIHSLVMYLLKMIWPLNLEPFYPYPKAVSLLSVTYLFSIGLVVVITGVCFLILNKQRFLFTAWTYYVVTLLPVLGLVQVGIQSMADRYTYLPSIGPFLILGFGIAWISNKMSALIMRRKIVGFLSAVFIIILFVVVIALTIKQIGIWKNGIIFWSYVIEKEPQSVPMAYCNRGVTYKTMGHLNEAIRDYDKAIALNPSFAKAYYNRGVALNGTGRADKAIADFDRTITLDPFHVNAYNQRGLLREKMGFRDKAVSDYNKAIDSDPNSPEAYFNLGVLYGRTGVYDSAVKFLSKAISLKPDNADYYSNRGSIYSLSGQNDRAIIDLNKAIELAPTIASAYYNRGVILNQKGRKESAISDLRKACELGDDDGCKGLHMLNDSANK